MNILATSFVAQSFTFTNCGAFRIYCFIFLFSLLIFFILFINFIIYTFLHIGKGSVIWALFYHLIQVIMNSSFSILFNISVYYTLISLSTVISCSSLYSLFTPSSISTEEVSFGHSSMTFSKVSLIVYFSLSVIIFII